MLYALARWCLHEQAVVQVGQHEVGDLRLAAGADDAVRHLDCVAGHVAARQAGRARREDQIDVDPLVDPGQTDAFAAASGDERGWAARPWRQHPVGVQAVAAKVHQRPAGQRQGPPRVLRLRGRNGHDGLDPFEVAQLTGSEQLMKAPRHRVVEVVKALDHDHARTLAGLAHLGGLVGVTGERLL